MQKKTFISKVFQMSSVMLLLNISNTVFSIYISKKAGAEGIGMFHLVMSIYSVAQVVSLSGIGLTVTRLLSDMPEGTVQSCADAVVSRCIRVCTVPSLIASLVLFSGADIIAVRILGDQRCALCLKILAIGLCPSAASAVITGYFTAFGRVKSIAAARFFSDGALWVCTLLLLRVYRGSLTYIAVVSGFLAATLAEFGVNAIIRQRSKNSLYCRGGATYGDILRLCLPLALGSYLRTGFTSAENVLIPSMLSRFGTKNPVAAYGIIKGMTMPILMFPMLFTGAFTSLLVPELARRRTLGFKNGIRYISELSAEYILKFAVFISTVYLIWYKDLSGAFFDESDAGVYLKMLFAFPVFMFLDSVVDSVLKALDKQVTSLKINICDSFLRVVFILVLLPKYGMMGYIAIMYLSELVNLGFSYLTLKKATDLRFPFKNGVIKPLFAAGLGVFVLKIFPDRGMWSSIALFGSVYIGILSCFKKI